MNTDMATQELWQRRLSLFPITAAVQPSPRQGTPVLTVAGCDLEALAHAHGTPLYCFDAATLDDAAAAYQRSLAAHYPGRSAVTYAGKAFCCKAIAQWTQRQGFWFDCTGAGEIGVAVAAGVPQQRILVHGVNKSDEDLDAALRSATPPSATGLSPKVSCRG